MAQELKRGQMYYIRPQQTTGSEQASNRPAIIVSNDMANKNSPVVEVVYLTTAKKNHLPTHVIIRANSRTSVALCEQVHSVDTSRVMNYFGLCSEEELAQVDQALRVSLGLVRPEDDDATGSGEKDCDECKALRDELLRKEGEIQSLTKQYERLLKMVASQRQ